MDIRTIFYRTLMVLSILPAIGVSSVFATKPVAYLPWSDVTSLDSGWLYLEDDPEGMPQSTENESFSSITLPHTWNAIDTLEVKKYRRAASWYRRSLDITAEDLKQRIYIRFGAAGQKAELYVNGKKQLSRKGGYTAFALELTDLVHLGKNQIDVRVSNVHDNELIPHRGDFNFYGGLYRSVHLLRGPTTGICRTYFASSGIRVWSPEVSEDQASLLSSVMLDHRGDAATKAKLTVTLTSPEGEVCGESSSLVTVQPGKAQNFPLPTIAVSKPQLWSPETPQLYTVNVTVTDTAGKQLDQATLRHGIRWFQFTADRGFFLNGKPYVLNGVNRHQDFYKLGNALTAEQQEADIRLIKESGSNWLRLAHYTQHDRVLDLCDELGLLVWEEIPWVGGTSFNPEFLTNMSSMMTEMIHQHFNYSSIIVWGISNEVRLKKGPDGKALQCPLVESLHQLIHELDPLRVSGLVSGDINTFSDQGVMDIPDVMGYNLYCGWYGRHPSDFIKRATQLHEKNPDKPMVITEYGAGSDQSIHTLTPRSRDFSEEWQIFYFEEHQKQAAQMPWLCGMTWWAFADFGAAHRGDSIPHVNQKGFVTYNREKKDLWYCAKALWSKDPVLHIQASKWTQRDGNQEQPIRVFSNMQNVELFHQGKSLGRKTEDFSWQVVLQPGENVLSAKGSNGDIKKEHTITVNWRAEVQRFVVTATKAEKDSPITNIADGKEFTRWSAEGPATVDIDLAHPVLLDGILFHFYKGASRQYKMEIQTSSDGKTYKSVFSGSSQGGKDQESILFEQVEARYIRIQAQGNDQGAWNSWHEVLPIISTDKKDKNIYEIIGAGEKE